MVTLALALPIAASAALAQQQLWFVPWKVLDRGAQPTPAPLMLFWLPASADDLKRSELVLSERLTAYAGRCVAMNVIRAEDEDAVARLGEGRRLPLAVLVDGDRKLGRVESENGALRLAAVESLVRGAFDTREAAVDAALIEAKKLAAADDRDQAIALYRGVAAQRCMFPRQAKTAARALRRLGAAE
jgi:hypothetical protein